MKKISSLLLYCAIVFAVSACSEKIKNTDEPPPGPGNGSSIIVGTPDVILSGSVSNGSGSDGSVPSRAAVTFTTENNWNCELSDNTPFPPEWFILSATYGDAGEATIQITATEDNPYFEDRNAFVRIKSGGSVGLITVTQKKQGALTASKDIVALNPSESSFTVAMTGSGYSVTIPEQYTHWLTHTPGGGGSSERFQVTPNITGQSRAGKVIFTSGERADTVNVYQKLSAEDFLLESNLYAQPIQPGVVTVHVSANTDFECVVDEKSKEWIHSYTSVPPMGYAPRVDRVFLSFDFLKQESHRTGTVLFTDKNTKQTNTLTVVQWGTATLVYYPEGVYTVPAEGETLTARASSDHQYSVIVPQQYSDWISVGTLSDETPRQLPITIQPNQTNYVRAGYVLLETQGKTISDTIHIEQLCHPDDKGILTALYETAGGSQWTNRTGWNTDAPLDQWYGVTTNPEGRVIKLELSGNNLSGEVIDYSVDLLDALEKLDLSHNRLTGVTARLGYLENLTYFDISDNEITGAMPDEYINIYCPYINNVAAPKDIEWFCVNDNYYSGEYPLFFSGSNSITQWQHFFNVIKQKGAGFVPLFNIGYDFTLPDLQYTDIDGRQISLRQVGKDNNYNVLFHSKEITDEVIADLQKLNSLARASIPGYSIGVIWDAVDSELSAAELQTLRTTHSLEFTVVNSASGSEREKYRFGEKSEFYLTNNLTRLVLFNYGIERIYNFLLPQDLYFSQDYSKNKTWRTVQTATVGQGVDIVFMGDGFTDVDIAEGKYDKYAEASFDALFSIEPFKSLRPRFNCYVVYAVSRNNDYDHPSVYTTFGCDPTIPINLTLKQYGYDVWPVYAACAPIRNVREVTIMMAVNYKDPGGIALDYTFESPGVAFTVTANDMQEYKNTMIHEMGHAYAGLADEYIQFNFSPSDYYREVINYGWEKYGWDSNLDFTDDLTQIKWKHFIGHPKYPYVGAFEGCTHKTGAWRPEIGSVMGGIDGAGYFNAPSREAIYKRTMHLSDEPYSFEKFVEQDNVTPPTPSSVPMLSAPQWRDTPPVRRP